MVDPLKFWQNQAMQQEIELKLLVPEDARTIIEQSVLPKLSAKAEKFEHQLLNHYFDTPDRRLRKHQIGFRVRSTNGQFEQTIKTAGQNIGGLHQRPEYNVSLPDDQPDLSLFAAEIFPDELQIANVQAELDSLFTTHFTRHIYLLTFDNGDQVEMAMDCGEITADKHKESICELELELKAGSSNRLFDVADSIAEHLHINVGNLSKAARGYQLADGSLLQVKSLPETAPLADNATIEQAFCQTLTLLLNDWQQQEIHYQQEPKVKILAQIKHAKGLLLRLLKVNAPLFNCPLVEQLKQQLEDNLEQWQWLESAIAFKLLRSKKGSFGKGLGKQDALLSYLRGRFEGLIVGNQPLQLLQGSQNHVMQLNFARLLQQKPWSNSAETAQPASQVAHKVLETAWEKVKQQLLKESSLNAKQYLKAQNLLKCSLQNGFLFGGLYVEESSDFRAPWLDIAEGIQELYTLDLLQHELPAAELQNQDELQLWCQEKIDNLLSVMEQSRAVAKQMQPYWREMG